MASSFNKPLGYGGVGVAWNYSALVALREPVARAFFSYDSLGRYMAWA